MTPSLRAHNLIGLMEDLVELLERENALLERPRSRELGPVIEEKQALFKLYEEQIHALANDNEFASALEPELRERLKEVGGRFEDLAKLNERKLKLVSQASERIVERIADAARRASGHVDSYGQSGASGAAPQRAAPVALNRSC
jgi:flagellar biosynthesis/type III secretory pathway chaperone